MTKSKVSKFLGGKWSWETINGKKELVLLPPKKAPSEKEVTEIFKRLAKC